MSEVGTKVNPVKQRGKRETGRWERKERKDQVTKKERVERKEGGLGGGGVE